MSKILLRCLLILCCSAAPALAAGKLRVGMSPDYPPLQYKHEGRVVGIEPDNAQAVGNILARQVEIVELPFDGLIPALEAGKIDVIMSGFSVTGKRSGQVMFTEPYLRVGQMAIMLKDNVARFAQPWSIYGEGIRVGVEPGTTGESFAERELKEAEVVRVKDPEEAFASLRAGWIDLYVHDAPTSWRLASTPEDDDLISLYAPLTEEMLAWGVKPGNHELLAELNRALSLMRSNGTLSYILNRWIPVKVEVSR